MRRQDVHGEDYAVFLSLGVGKGERVQQPRGGEQHGGYPPAGRANILAARPDQPPLSGLADQLAQR